MCTKSRNEEKNFRQQMERTRERESRDTRWMALNPNGTPSRRGGLWTSTNTIQPLLSTNRLSSSLSIRAQWETLLSTTITTQWREARGTGRHITWRGIRVCWRSSVPRNSTFLIKTPFSPITLLWSRRTPPPSSWENKKRTSRSIAWTRNAWVTSLEK